MNTPLASTRPRTRDLAIAGALLLGLLADLLVRVPGRPGLNVTLWALAGTAVLWLIARRSEATVARETQGLVGGAVLFAGLLMLRDAEALAVFCLFAAVVLLGLAAGRGARAWAVHANFVELAASAVRMVVLIVLGPFGWSAVATRQPAEPAPQTGSPWRRKMRTLARGAVMALPPLIVLTALLTSADPVFERVLHNALFDSLEPLLEHLLFAGVIAWFTSGYLRAFLVNDDAALDRMQLPRPAVASSEITVAFSLIGILFIVFLAVQARYLFGGAGLVEVTPGLSYAEYARRGFFEMVAAAVLVVPVLLVADWVAAEDDVRSRRLLRATSLLLVLLLGGVLASAAYRMRLYQEAYGLTEDRLFVSVFIVWLTFVLIWFAMTVLRGRRRGFAFGAIVAGLVCIAALHVLNPHALITRVNIRRAISGAEYDGKYLRSLSADAVPTLITHMAALPATERCNVEKMLSERWSGERPGGWRTWNMSDAGARALVAEMAPVTCGSEVAGQTSP